MAPIGAPPPFLFGGKRFVALIKTTRMQMHRGNEITCRHCEKLLRRSNPGAACIERWIASLPLAMTEKSSAPAIAGEGA